MFSELAVHPNIHSQHMLKLAEDGNMALGPFMEKTSLQAGIGEMGRLAVLVGEVLDASLPDSWDLQGARKSFVILREEWIKIFCSR